MTSLPRFVLRHLCIATVCCLVLLTGSCSSPERGPDRAGKPTYVATIRPVEMIVREIAGERANVVCLLSPSQSPHTYDPRPSDVRTAKTATALVYVSDNLDGWAARLESPHRISLMELLPGDYHLVFGEEQGHEQSAHGDACVHPPGSLDPHFWLDPLAVKAIVPALAAEMAVHDPEGGAVYTDNAGAFLARLDELDGQISLTVAPIVGQSVLSFHPSFRYFTERYGLVYAGSIEEAPGKEASLAHLREITDRIQRDYIKAVFTEPQLPARSAQVIGDTAGVPVYTLDPIGGSDDRATYESLLIYNAGVFREALE